MEPADRSGYPRPISLVLGTKLQAPAPRRALVGWSGLLDRLSANTVKTHTRGIFRKLATSSRDEAVERFRADGLLQ